jgi:hypothetical protein
MKDGAVPMAQMTNSSGTMSRIRVEQSPLVVDDNYAPGDVKVAAACLSEVALDIVAELIAPYVGFGLAEIPPSRVTGMLKEGRFSCEVVYWC